MIELRRITSSSSDVLISLLELYDHAFPDAERRPIDQLKKLIDQNNSMFFNAIFCEEKLCGLFAYWSFEGFYFLEHFAVFEQMRNQNIGAKVLDYLEEKLQGVRILEVEPDTTDMATRRIEYYRRNGYRIVEKNYTQPSFDGIKPTIQLWIMCNKPLEPSLLNAYISIIQQKAYRDHVSL